MIRSSHTALLRVGSADIAGFEPSPQFGAEQHEAVFDPRLMAVALGANGNGGRR